MPRNVETTDAKGAAAASFASLLGDLNYLPDHEVDEIRRAYRYADEAHLGQVRKSGIPYITHPIAVCKLCTQWKLDAQALMAALLHDVMEDCGISKAEISKQFGAPVGELVDGLTKLDKLQFSSKEENQAESFRKMLLAMARDVRVILIKLADRTHNMRTMADMARASQIRISTETLEIYAPIAHRLGLHQTYRELQDLAFQQISPWRHRILAKAIARARSRRKDLLAKVMTDVEAAFSAHNIVIELTGREKTLYSLFRKMRSKKLTFANVNDIYGFRLIVPAPMDCYTGLGLLHQLYKPVPGKFKDHIAIPKANGYQSLHTTVVGPASVNIEFQLRTKTMHVVAESGVAAHWLYKASLPPDAAPSVAENRWLQSLLDIQSTSRDAADFWDHIKVDLFTDAIYVFTPKGKIISLPRGATVLDFAYAIHSNIGNHATAGTVNGEPAPIEKTLRNGDVVEVVTSPDATPNPAWISLVHTGRARSHIRNELKNRSLSESAALGEQLLLQALRAEGIAEIPPSDAGHAKALWDKLLRFSGNATTAELFTDIGLGKRLAPIVAKRMAGYLVEAGIQPDAVLLSTARFVGGETRRDLGGFILDGSANASIQYANCCMPVPGDPVKGYLGRGEGLMVHRMDCPVLARLEHRDADRFIDVVWSDEPVRAFEAQINILATNAKGVLATLANTIAGAGIDISHIDMGEQTLGDTIRFVLTVAVDDVTQLDGLISQVALLPAVLSVGRAKGGRTATRD